MRSEYDFSESRKNPYVNQLKRQITIRLDSSAVDALSEPHQSVPAGLRHAQTAPGHSMAQGSAEAGSGPLNTCPSWLNQRSSRVLPCRSERGQNTSSVEPITRDLWSRRRG